MCTAVSYLSGDHYFGRNLDLEYSYNESVVITPRNFTFAFRNGHKLCNHYAMIGVATVADNYPLYYEATNEKGLSVAALNFPDNATYFSHDKNRENYAPFELIPIILGNCKNAGEAKQFMSNLNIWSEAFGPDFPLSPLHWMIADKNHCLTVEQTAEGLKVYDNPVGVLTNNPPFPYHLHNLTNYMSLTPNPPVNNQPIPLKPYSLGMGSFGLPGDMSSGSRFVKAAFTKLHSINDPTEESAVSQFFHILGSARQPRGLTILENGKHEYTLYSSCCNTDKGIYYYTTYQNSRINAIQLHKEDLEKDILMSYPLLSNLDILFQN